MRLWIMLGKLQRHWWLLVTIMVYAISVWLFRWWLPIEPRVKWKVGEHRAIGSLSADGTRVATYRCEEILGDVCPSGPIELWDATTGQRINTILRENGVIYTPCFSPDSTMAAVTDGVTLRILDLVQGAEVAQYSAHVNTLFHGQVCFSPDSRFLVFATYDGVDSWVCVWDRATQRIRLTIRGAGSPIAISPDSRLLVACSLMGAEDFGRLWDLVSGKEVGRISGVRSPLLSWRWSPWAWGFSRDGTRVGLMGEASDSGTWTVQWWRVDDRTEDGWYEFQSTHWWPGRRWTAYITMQNLEGDIMAFDAETGELGRFPGSLFHASDRALCFPETSGTTLLVHVPNVFQASLLDKLYARLPFLGPLPSSVRDQAWFFDIPSGICLGHIEYHRDVWRAGGTVVTNGRTVATIDAEQMLRVWDLPLRAPWGKILLLAALPAGLVGLARWSIRRWAWRQPCDPALPSRFRPGS